MTKVSLIISCFNKANYVDSMFESVVNQTWNNVELVIINDGSTDGTAEKIEEWRSKFINRGYELNIINQENKGLGHTVKIGLLNATGDYVCVVDADDVLSNRYISIMATMLDNNSNIKWVQSRMYVDNSLKYSLQKDFLAYHLCQIDFLSVCIKMFRYDYMKSSGLLDNYIEFRNTQEPQINLPLIISGGEFGFVDEVLYHNIYHENSLSVSYDYVTLWKEYKGAIKEYLKLYNKEEPIYQTILDYLINYRMNMLNPNGFEKFDDTLKNDIIKFLIEHGYSKSVLIDLDWMILGFLFEMNIKQINIDGLANKINDKLQRAENVIMVGSLGKKAKMINAVINFADVKIDAYWDNAAKIKVSFDNKVSSPCYSSLSDNDIVFCPVERIEYYNQIINNISNAYVLDIGEINIYLFNKIKRKLGMVI